METNKDHAENLPSHHQTPANESQGVNDKRSREPSHDNTDAIEPARQDKNNAERQPKTPQDGPSTSRDSINEFITCHDMMAIMEPNVHVPAAEEDDNISRKDDPTNEKNI
jgi:hypothetical protein